MIVIAQPSAKNQVKTLRTIGYTFNSAAADILDNSIAAGADRISIELSPIEQSSGHSLLVSFTDNGSGMSESDLLNAMQIACRDPDEKRASSDLGRFGTGLKTASFSQAKRLTVVTKKKDSLPSGAIWDLDLIEREDQWLLEKITRESDLEEHLNTRSGTKVIWEKVDSIEEGAHIDDFLEQLNSITGKLRKHISLHFHKFLENGVDISVNGLKLEPINPFMVDVSGYHDPPAPDKVYSKYTVLVTAHHLPPYENLTPMEQAVYGTPAEVIEDQGLYIYRNDRLISYGSWNGLFSKSSERGRVRVEVQFNAAEDQKWKTDLKKDSVKIPLVVARKITAVLKKDFIKAEKIVNYKPRVTIDTDYWEVREDERTGEVHIKFKSNNLVFKKILMALPSEEAQRLRRLIQNAVSDIPIKQIFSRYKG